ncbi:MAG: hypothetical protein ACPGU1_05115 [Myxococcota bacterium]
MKPSASAILIPADNVEGVLALVDRAFGRRGFREWTKQLPAGYPLRRDEWFDFGIGLQVGGNTVLLLPSDVESVFRVCVVLSSTLGDTPIVGMRRFMGMEPVMKLYRGGKPRWRDGQDDDLESKYEVPTERPSDGDGPEAFGLPSSAIEMEDVLGDSLRRYEAARRDPNSDLTWRSYLSRKSRLYQG